ncbi:hypothetical protein EJ02DRAFT_481962 [Clathrospora elynae]|uniref:Thioredoxin domain-containing protein n=1 Tax=Clathrospora elynae TaxID=706981 RepID=A0A6A5SXG9_9PLEO|nr:hypothetical protein EJ02DRAFT_481962 [Clathrospora elynae]
MILPTLRLAPLQRLPTILHIPSKRAFSLLPSSSTPSNQPRIFDPIRQPNDLHTLTLLSAADNRTLITLWTTSYCATCQVVTPLIRRLIEDEQVGGGAGLGFAEVLLDSSLIEHLPLTYRISSVPTLLAFSRLEAQFDTRVTRVEDLSDEGFLREWLRREAQREGRRGGGKGGWFGWL